MKISQDVSDLLFRALFSCIFIGLGAEHIFSDELILKLMPEWVPMRHVVSLACGVWLVGWGGCVLLGYRVHLAAYGLGAFLVIVTLLVHVPGVLQAPPELDPKFMWLWTILQRSNLVKNLCLLGVCFWLLHHEVGKHSLDSYFAQRRSA